MKAHETILNYKTLKKEYAKKRKLLDRKERVKKVEKTKKDIIDLYLLKIAFN